MNTPKHLLLIMFLALHHSVLASASMRPLVTGTFKRALNTIATPVKTTGMADSHAFSKYQVKSVPQASKYPVMMPTGQKLVTSNGKNNLLDFFSQNVTESSQDAAYESSDVEIIPEDEESMYEYGDIDDLMEDKKSMDDLWDKHKEEDLQNQNFSPDQIYSQQPENFVNNYPHSKNRLNFNPSILLPPSLAGLKLKAPIAEDRAGKLSVTESIARKEISNSILAQTGTKKTVTDTIQQAATPTVQESAIEKVKDEEEFQEQNPMMKKAAAGIKKKGAAAKEEPAVDTRSISEKMITNFGKAGVSKNLLNPLNRKKSAPTSVNHVNGSKNENK